MSGRLAGKRALITGGTRGIGDAITRRFVEEGARTVITGRQADAPAHMSADIYLRADSAIAEEVIDAVDAADRELGGIDILVNNAGIEIEKSLEDTTLDDWDRLMAINARAVFLYARQVIPVMRRGGGGSIVNLGSISALAADPGLAVYNASKAAVLGLTRSIAVENGRDGIRCNAICPGWIDTDMLAQTFSQAEDEALAREQINAMHPLGRLGRPEDIAQIALWLASDESAFATGQTFTLDGGLIAGSPADPNRF